MAEPTEERTGSLEDLASLLSVVAHPIRLTILQELCAGVRCVSDLNDLIPISQPNLSQHMSALRKAGLVDCHSNGPLRCYYVIRPSLVEALLRLQPERHPTRLRSRESVLAEITETQQKHGQASKETT